MLLFSQLLAKMASVIALSQTRQTRQTEVYRILEGLVTCSESKDLILKGIFTLFCIQQKPFPSSISTLFDFLASPAKMSAAWKATLSQMSIESRTNLPNLPRTSRLTKTFSQKLVFSG
jgi:hypothetical protein